MLMFCAFIQFPANSQFNNQILSTNFACELERVHLIFFVILANTTQNCKPFTYSWANFSNHHDFTKSREMHYQCQLCNNGINANLTICMRKIDVLVCKFLHYLIFYITTLVINLRTFHCKANSSLRFSFPLTIAVLNKLQNKFTDDTESSFPGTG